LFGITDLDYLDGLEGIASGILKKDVRKSYDKCYEPVPLAILDGLDKMHSIDFSDFLNFAKDG